MRRIISWLEPSGGWADCCSLLMASACITATAITATLQHNLERREIGNLAAAFWSCHGSLGDPKGSPDVQTTYMQHPWNRRTDRCRLK